LVSHRTGDLLRIATGGTGQLPSGALHPDLVDRPTREVCATAADALQMCIRAMDYCPHPPSGSIRGVRIKDALWVEFKIS
jgi:hypothetical protein